MSIITENIFSYLPFITYIFAALGLCIFMLAIGFFLGGRSSGRTKGLPFESGINSFGTARLRFSAKFYLVAMFFVIFDVEGLYLYTWAVSIRETGWIGFIEAAIFILNLLVGLFYLVSIGALDWTKSNHKRIR